MNKIPMITLGAAIPDATVRDMVKQMADLGANVEHKGDPKDSEGESFVVRTGKGKEIFRALVHSSRKVWLVRCREGLFDVRVAA